MAYHEIIGRVSDKNGYQRFVSQQIHYTLEAREAEYELLPIGIDQGLGALIWSPLAGGLLSGKYTRDTMTQAGSRFANGWNEPPIRDFNRLWNIVDVLNDIAKERETSAAQIALAWTLTRPSVTSLVVGARKQEQLEDNIAAVNIKLTKEELEKLNEVSRIPLLYLYWHQACFAVNRMSEADKSLLSSK